MTPRDDATERQVQAARPNQSTWLAANAGSGKTRVLTDRVARLLLDGVNPQHILCLTYTKAAASEMQNRLFRRLGAWAMLKEDDLRIALEALGVEGDLDPERLARARTLFARAIEVPGGLKIQTIHSFCAGLLRRFPLEAGVSPQFSEIEDRAAALLRAEIVEDLASGPKSDVVTGVARYLNEGSFDTLTASITRHRQAFSEPLDRSALHRLFGLPASYDAEQLFAGILTETDLSNLRVAIPLLATGGKTDQRAATKLSGATGRDRASLQVLETVLLTGPSAKSPFSAKIGTFPTKALRDGAMASLMPWLDDLMQRVEDTRAHRLGLDAADRALALHTFAAEFAPEYSRRKQLRGWLDFDDLILKARGLLNDPAVAAWVLFRLDGGIDHILVDEAQDTSPDQWDVIERLSQEFTSGAGARSDVTRTIFVVGDKKQSIYSFQGADPTSFDRMQADFSDRLSAVGLGLESLTLEHSFRSSEAILRLVDLVFEDQDDAGFPRDGLHRAFKADMPGRVDLWPAVPKSETPDDQPWTDPVDRPGPRHHTTVLAESIANHIKTLISTKATIPDEHAQPGKFMQRLVEAQDFLILVQRRSALFSEIIRACKTAGLPIAGADRLKVGAELAVKDLGALLSFLGTPEDDLSLAAALKSPLFGWSEKMLFELAHDRGKAYLWQALRNRSDEFPEVMGVLTDLRSQADFLRPYDLIERILTRHSGRQRLLARLGPEAEDGINALLSQALSYESTNVPSLTGFLVWMQTDDLEIKRQSGSAAGMIRVMTVHGAKGLEAPIVILPDTGPRPVMRGDTVVLADNHALWRMPADAMPPLLAEARNAEVAKSERERLRLLYVALTRAESWLIVAAAGDVGGSASCWFDLVEAAMPKAGATRHAFPTGEGLRLEHGDWSASAATTERSVPRSTPPLPKPLRTAAPAPSAIANTTVSPSDLGGAKALPGEDGEAAAIATARGTAIHLLLQNLPNLLPEHWASFAATLLPEASDSTRNELLQEARDVLKSPELAFLFEPSSLSEVPVTAQVGARRIHGTIDRLILSDDRVLVVDFKSNAIVPATPDQCPEGILRQMGAYAHAINQVYPDRSVETAIVWTRTAAFMSLPHDLVTGALLRTGMLDDTNPRS